MRRNPNVLEDGTTCLYCRKTGIPLQKYHWFAYWICEACLAQEPARIAQENAVFRKQNMVLAHLRYCWRTLLSCIGMAPALLSFQFQSSQHCSTILQRISHHHQQGVYRCRFHQFEIPLLALSPREPGKLLPLRTAFDDVENRWPKAFANVFTGCCSLVLNGIMQERSGDRGLVTTIRLNDPCHLHQVTHRGNIGNNRLLLPLSMVQL